MFGMTRRLAAAALAACILSLSAPAQDTRATLLGTVRDQSRGAVVGAQVTAANQLTNERRTVLTDSRGQFRIPFLKIGVYTISVQAAGFQTAQKADLRLGVDQEVRVDFSLTVESIASQIEVVAPLSSGSAAVQERVVGTRQIEDLPLNGRQLQEQALIAPGIFAGGGSRSTAFNQFGLATPLDGNAGAFAANGAGSRSNGFILDGVDINIPEQGVIGFPPAVEAIAEFQIQTSSFQAEFGRYSGAIVNMVTKSGQNRVHGSVYEFFRNDALDANNFFNNRAGLERSTLRQNQFGFTLGGPLRKDRDFFFVNYEGSRITVGTGPFTSTLPDSRQRQGLLDFVDAQGAARQLDLSGRIAPTSARLLELAPLPNLSGTGANFIIDEGQTMNENQVTVRTDHQLSQRDNLTVRYTFDDQNQVFPFDVFFVGPPLPTFPFDNPEQRQSLSLAHFHSFSSSAFNELRFGLNRQVNPIPNGDVTDPAALGLPNSAPQDVANGVPTVFVSGFGGSAGQPLLGGGFTGFFANRTVFQLIDNFSWTRGAHSWKFGGEARWIQVNNGSFSGLRGSLVFNGSRNGTIDPSIAGNAPAAALADFLLGLPSQASIAEGSRQRGFRAQSLDLFVQDQIRVSPRLTLNLGLRYEYNSPPEEVNGLLGNFVPGRGNLIVGQPGLEDLHRPDRNNFAPRAGLAYRLRENGKSVLRAGAGVYYDHTIIGDRSGIGVAFNPPFGLSVTSNSPLSFPADGTAAETFTSLLGAGQPTGTASVDTGFRSPYSVQWNLSLQHELPGETVLEAAYVGRRSVNLSRRLNINQVPAGSLSPEQLRQAAAQDPEFGTSILRPFFPQFSSDISQQQSTGQAIYHSFQGSVEKRYSQGMSLLASYTYSKSIDDVSGIGSGADDIPQDAFDLRSQRGVSNFDITHRFQTSFTYAIPFGSGRAFGRDLPALASALAGGWQVAGKVTAQSGQPFTVTMGAFDGLTQTSNKRPDLVGDPDSGVPQGFAFNPSAFAAPAEGAFGSAGRNILRGDGYFNVDFSVFKAFPISQLGESGQVEFRAEFFNLFNNVNFTFPVRNLASPAFGRFVDGATPPRIVQFALKVKF